MKKSEASMLCIRRIESFTTATPAVISMFRASPLFTAVLLMTFPPVYENYTRMSGVRLMAGRNTW